MITGELKSQIDRVWEAFWTGGLSNPLTVIYWNSIFDEFISELNYPNCFSIDFKIPRIIPFLKVDSR
jgi:hypothetical protein